jgi:endo-1,4-beta-xylanase
MPHRFIAVASLLFVANVVHAQPTTLKEAFHGVFRIGAALNQSVFDEKDARDVAIVTTQFDTISPENVLKWGSIHPRPDAYNFDPADHYVAFGEKHKMFIVGHNLVWHSQTPAWVFKDDQGAPLTRDALLERMHDHIRTVVGRYKGRIGGWDVVNEALNDDGTLRKSQWLNIIGEDYIAKAFQFAHEADPAAELYYNDYSVENEAKRKGVVELIRKLLAQSVTVTAVGLQGHDKLDWPTAKQQADTIEAFAALGVKVCITEFDVDVLPRNAPGNSADISATASGGAGTNPYTAGLPDDVQQALARRYAELFDVFVKYRASVSRVTFWGGSWLNNYPMRGRTNYPLLFDREGKPKPAFFSVIGTARGAK